MYFPEWKYGSCDLLKFTPKGPINNNPALVLIMAWCRPGDKPLSEPTMISLLTHICVTQSYWVKTEMIRPIIPLALNHLNLQIICIWNIPKLFTSKKSNGFRGKLLQSFLATVFTLQIKIQIVSFNPLWYELFCTSNCQSSEFISRYLLIVTIIAYLSYKVDICDLGPKVWYWSSIAYHLPCK